MAAVDTQAGDADVPGVVAVFEVVGVVGELVEDEGDVAAVDGGVTDVIGPGEAVVAAVVGGTAVPTDWSAALPPHPTSRTSAIAGIAAPSRIRLAGVVTARTLPAATVGAAAALPAGDQLCAPTPSSADSAQILRGRSRS